MQEEMERQGELEEGTEETRFGEGYWDCRYCSAKFPKTPQGRVELMTHVKFQHGGGGRRKSKDGDPLSPGSDVDEDDMPPMVVRLFRVLRRHLPKHPGLVATIVENFHANIDVLSKDRHRFRAWLSKYGLTPEVLTAVEDVMFGVEMGERGEAAHQTGGMPSVQYVSTPTGPMPVIIVPQGSGQASQGWQGMTAVQMPWLDEVNRRMDRLEAMIERLAERVREPPAPPPPPPREPEERKVFTRKVRRPVMGPEGPVTDEKGRIVYEEYEEPYDPSAAAQAQLMQMVHTLADVLRPQTHHAPPQVDEEKLYLKIKAELSELQGRAQSDPELKQQVANLQELVHQLITSRREEEAYQAGYRKAREELIPKLEAIEKELRERTATQNMSEQGIISTRMLDHAKDTINRLATDIREMVQNQMILQAAQMGVVDKETFSAYVAARGAKPQEPSEAAKAEILERVRRR